MTNTTTINRFEMSMALLPSDFWEGECEISFEDFMSDYPKIVSLEIETGYGQNDFIFIGDKEELRSLYGVLTNFRAMDEFEETLTPYES